MRTHAIPAAVRLGMPLAATAMVVAACGSTGSSGSTGATGSGGKTTTTSSSSSGMHLASMVKTAHGSHGSYLVDGSGHALYLFAKDKGGKSSCDSSCASFWPPAEVHGKPKAGSGVQAAALGTATRSGGAMQVTYHGHPLYYYAQDSKPGDTLGQGQTTFGGLWTLVSPAGTSITGKAKGSGGSGSSGSGSSGSGSSGSGSGGSWG